MNKLNPLKYTSWTLFYNSDNNGLYNSLIKKNIEHYVKTFGLKSLDNIEEHNGYLKFLLQIFTYWFVNLLIKYAILFLMIYIFFKPFSFNNLFIFATLALFFLFFHIKEIVLNSFLGDQLLIIREDYINNNFFKKVNKILLNPQKEDIKNDIYTIIQKQKMITNFQLNLILHYYVIDLTIKNKELKKQ